MRPAIWSPPSCHTAAYRRAVMCRIVLAASGGGIGRAAEGRCGLPAATTVTSPVAGPARSRREWSLPMQSERTELREPRARDGLPEPVDVILRDGRTLRLRPPLRADVPALAAFFRALSPASLYNRFHGAVSVDETTVERFVEPDFVERGALIGVAEDRVVALGDWARLRDPRSAEAAFAVADELQGSGIGTRLLERLAAVAGEA